mgnify:CR=1 FL=1
MARNLIIYNLYGTEPSTSDLVNLVKLNVLSEKVSIEVGVNAETAYPRFKFQCNVLPNSNYRRIQEYRQLEMIPQEFVGLVEGEGNITLDGDGEVGYVRVGDVVALITTVQGYSTDIRDVVEYAFPDEEFTLRYLVFGISEVDTTDFYEPFTQPTVKARVFVDGGYVSGLANVGKRFNKTLREADQKRSSEVIVTTSPTARRAVKSIDSSQIRY